MAVKVKLKLDTAQIQQFLINHVEKIGLAIGGAVLLYLIYGSFGHTPLQRLPDQLTSDANSARQLFGPNSPGPEATEVKSFEGDVEKSAGNITLASYKVERPLQRPLELGGKRGEPEYLAVIELQTAYGYGAFPKSTSGSSSGQPLVDGAASIAGDKETDKAARAAEVARRLQDARGGGGRPSRAKPAANNDKDKDDKKKDELVPEPPTVNAPPAEGKMWVVITGLVPTKLQYEAYKAAFGNAQFRDPEGADLPQWIGFLLERAAVPQGAESADLKWEPISVRPAMEQARKAWGGNTLEVVDPLLTDERLTFPLPPLLGRPWDESVAHAKLPMQAGDPTESAPDATPDGESPAGDGTAPPADEPFDLPSQSPTETARSNAVARAKAKQNANKETPEFTLFRFMDFTVQPNVSYRYRVRLALANPNLGVDPRFLEKPELGDKTVKGNQYRLSGWSEPSPAVTVGGLGRLHLTGPSQPGSGLREPTVSVIAEQFILDAGVEAVAVIDKVSRGQAVNRQDVSVIADVPIKGGYAPSLQTVSFSTNNVVVDMISDERGNDSQALVLGSDLKMYVVSQLPPSDPIMVRVKRNSGATPREKNKDKPGDAADGFGDLLGGSNDK
ncbi:MAG: hypothetical protein K1X74_15895 [Pirellulales bacterium]|nr:hypothetical protein [Pirellulales bacterium]